MREGNSKDRTDIHHSNNQVLNKNSTSTDRINWTPARIKYVLAEQGLSLADIARRHGYHETAASRALRVAWPAVEQIIAEAIGVTPQEIWPDRYDPETGIPKSYLPRRRRRQGDATSSDDGQHS